MPKLICPVCENPFHVPAYRQATARYCSRSCGHCGQAFEALVSRSAHGRGKFCSRNCKNAARRAKPRTATVQFTCLNCTQKFALYRSQLRRKKGAGKYCSRRCRDDHRVGKNHPQYLNGSASEKYGPNWQAQKRKAKRRDRWTCQHCGMGHKECLAQYGQGLQVHHVRPFRLFGTYIEANRLPNLRTCCPGCHRKADAAFQALEREIAA